MDFRVKKKIQQEKIYDRNWLDRVKFSLEKTCPSEYDQECEFRKWIGLMLTLQYLF